MVGLTEDQELAYRRDGFLCPLDVMTHQEVTEARAGLEGLERDFASGLPRPVSEYLRSSAHIATDVPLQVATDARVLDCVEGILGPDILLWGCEYFIKEANTDKIVSWHQDLTYWGMDGSDHEVTAWVALSPATAESGCMKFVPGSHKHQIVPHNDTFAGNNILSRGQEIAVDVNEDDAIVAALQPGQMSLHHGRLFHASGPNTTGDRRIGLVMRYVRPDTPSSGQGRDFAMLVRGADRTRNRINVLPPPGSFTPAKLALYDEVSTAQAEVLAAGLDSPDEMYAAKESANV